MSVQIDKTDAPGVYRVEKDQTGGTVTPLGTRVTAIVGMFEKGPTNVRTLIKSQADLIKIFGNGDIEKYGYAWYSAYDLLEETDQIIIVRYTIAPASGEMVYSAIKGVGGVYSALTTPVQEVKTTDVLNATELPEGKGNSSDYIYPLEQAVVATDELMIASTSPGADGDLLGIQITGAIKTLTPISSPWGSTESVNLGEYYSDGARLWVVTTAGDIGATEPTWPSVNDGSTTVSDGTAVWTNVVTVFLDGAWTTGVTVNSGERLIDPNGKAWECTTTGVTGATEPTWTDPSPITDGGVVWTEMTTVSPTWPGSVVAVGDLYKSGVNWWKVVSAGTVNGIEPTWPTSPVLGQEVVDGSAVWVNVEENSEKDVLGLRNRYPNSWWKILRMTVHEKADASSSFPSTGIDEFYFTLDDTTTPGGVALFAEDQINGFGQGRIYARVGVLSAPLTEVGFDSANYTTSGIVALASGSDGTGITETASGALTEELAGWELFRSREYSRWNLTCVTRVPESDATFSVAKKVNDICATRMDSMLTAQADRLTDIRQSAVEITSSGAFAGLKDPSYTAYYVGWDKRFDTFSGKRIFLPKCIEGARAILKTSRLKSNADAPAGEEVAVSKGFDQNVVWTKTQVGAFGALSLNSSLDKSSGNTLWMQRTALRTESKRDRIHVRRILNEIGVDLENIGDGLIWRGITPKLVDRLYSAFDRYLGQKQGADYFNILDGNPGYKIEIDTTNAGNNRLDVVVYVRPRGVLEYLGLELIVTDDGVSLSEA